MTAALRRGRWHPIRSAGGVVLVATLLAGCQIPTDPDGTLDEVRASQVLRAGASPAAGWVEIGPGGQVSGREAELVTDFAAHLGASVQWTVAGEEQLVAALEHDRVDLVIGGLTSQTPWASKVAMSKPYTEQVDEYGKPAKHVIFVQLGENAFLSELELFLGERGSDG